MNSRPMILRLRSGSVTPASFFRNRSPARASRKFRWYWSRKVETTSSTSFSRRSPLSTKMDVSFFPMALWRRTARTDESTPPERAQSTRSFPTCSRIRWMFSSMKEPMVQVGLQPQIRKRKFWMMAMPLTVWCTSGWNCTP